LKSCPCRAQNKTNDELDFTRLQLDVKYKY